MELQPPREPEFDAVHAPLREDVGYLGALLGNIISKESPELFQAVERARLLSIGRRERGEPPDALREALAGLHSQQAGDLTRAFSNYFSLTNLAEQVHRIRRRRDYQQEPPPQPGSLASVFASLRELGPDQVWQTLNDLQVIPVFTAHPTEATRRTVLRKEQRIARALVDRIEQTRRTPMEDRRITDRITNEIALIWQTAETSPTGITVADEVEHVLFFLSEVIYRIVPAVHESVEAASLATWAEEPARSAPCPLIRFGSWVGADMDGNPNVGADTILQTLTRQREIVLERYRAEVRALFEHLSQSDSRVTVSPEVEQQSRHYQEMFPGVVENIPARYRDMPYRAFLWLIWERLGRTAAETLGAYDQVEEFILDLEHIDQSLTKNCGEDAGRALLRRLLVRARTFGFHLATLDLRQDAELHRKVLGPLLGDATFSTYEPAARAHQIARALEDETFRFRTAGDDETRKALEVFRAVAKARTKFGENSIGPFIISMAQGVDDLLAVLALARAAGLRDDNGQVPLDITPLFETVADLTNASRTLLQMLSHPVYRSHLETRGLRQMVMLGYSDSAKISGVGASRWALYRAQEELVATAAEQGVHLVLFHGRGGTIARGGSKPRAAILAEPPGSVRGHLRTTEQGEIINGKFGLRGIAERTLQLATGAVLEATLRQDDAAPLASAWREAMSTLADTSREAWESLVHQDPRFIPYFHAATPIDVIQLLSIGSRPASRRTGIGVENLRAIPWVFAWTQSRHLLPGWYGLGQGLAAARQAHGIDLLREMAAGWPFFDNLLADAEMVLAKADLDIASCYASLAGDEERTLFDEIQEHYAATCRELLDIRQAESLLEREPVLREVIRLRNPYVDPMSMIQVDLLRRWREGDRKDEVLLSTLFQTVRGIARGLRNTG